MTERLDDKALWARQWEVFHAAVERPSIERAGFLAEACPDAELPRAVEQLLTVHEAGPGPLHEPLEIALGNELDGTPVEEATPLRRASDSLPGGRILAERFEIRGCLPLPRAQLRLAEVYRLAGRQEEALAIEDELRRYCAYADPDFPILLELEKRARSIPVAPA